MAENLTAFLARVKKKEYLCTRFLFGKCTKRGEKVSRNVIQIDRHIEILLLDNDCVIVPGLGGFMAHHVSARYYDDTRSYVPPLRQLGFNAQLTINDSLLAQSYIEAYDISYPEAVRRIAAEVTELKQKLQNEGFCELNDIGTLRQDIDGRLEFVPCDAGILSPALYGLDSVDIKPLADTVETAIPVTGQKPTPVAHLAAATRTAPKPRRSRERTITIRVSTLQRMAAAAAVAVVLFVCALPLGKTTRPEVTESYMDTGVLYNILPEAVRHPVVSKPTAVAPALPKPAAKQQESGEKSAKAQQDTRHTAEADTQASVHTLHDDEPKAAAKPAQPQQPSHYFSIVLASRVTKANAQAFVASLRKGGYDRAEIVERSNGAKVTYGRFGTKAEAQTFLTNLRKRAADFQDGWVMEF